MGTTRRTLINKGNNKFESEKESARFNIETLRRYKIALQKIASCEKRADGDVVDIARKALG